MRIYDQDDELNSLLGFSIEKDLEGVTEMSWSQGGNFTRNLLSLQLQLQTLLEGVGGEGTASLLDRLAQLSESERKRVIPLLSRVVGRILQGEKRVISAEDKELQNFEDSLFDSIMTALGQSANDDRVELSSDRKLEVVDGGKGNIAPNSRRKPVKVPSLIDLAKAREHRRQRLEVPPTEAS
jgi:hypothetical protein